MVLVDNQNRSKLAEGRSWGIGFAFCKREGETYTTIMPVSPCKDYLNDVVYSEHTGKPFQAHGLSTKKEGIFDTHAYIVMGILPYNRTTKKHSEHDDLEKALIAPPSPLISFLAHFEAMLCIPPTTTHLIASNRVLATLDLKWVQGSYLISLWSLLMRVGLKYKDGDPMEFLRKVSDGDAYLVKPAIPKIERLAKEGLHPQDFSTLTDVHNCGIVSYNW